MALNLSILRCIYGEKWRFWGEMAPILASRVPKWPEIGLTCTISMKHSLPGCLKVFLTDLEHLATEVGFSPIEGQLFSSDRDQTSMHCWKAKYNIGHMRPALFLVYFCSNFMVLVLKRLKIRVIASNLQKCGKKRPFWTYALDKISNFDCLWLLWCFFWYCLSNILAHHWKEFKTASLTRSGVQK